MAQVSPQLPAPASLLGLPREIRDQIYDNIFQHQEPFSVRLLIAYDGCNNKGWIDILEVSYTQPDYEELPYEDHGTTRPRGMTWVLTNKQIYQEAIALFQRNATWILWDGEYYFDHTLQGLPHYWSTPIPSHRDMRFQPYLLMPSSARNIALEHDIILMPGCQPNSQGHPVWTSRISFESLPRLFSQLQGSTNFPTLRISIDTAMLTQNVKEDAVRPSFDTQLSPLDLLDVPSLAKLEVRMSWDKFFGDHPALVGAVEKELEELARKLIGGKNTMIQVMRTEIDRWSDRWAVLHTYTRV